MKAEKIQISPASFDLILGDRRFTLWSILRHGGSSPASRAACSSPSALISSWRSRSTSPSAFWASCPGPRGLYERGRFSPAIAGHVCWGCPPGGPPAFSHGRSARPPPSAFSSACRCCGSGATIWPLSRWPSARSSRTSSTPSMSAGRRLHIRLNDRRHRELWRTRTKTCIINGAQGASPASEDRHLTGGFHPCDHCPGRIVLNL